jgi:hypothetical protein
VQFFSEHFPGRGELRPIHLAFREPESQLTLELADLKIERLRLHMKPLGCAAEVQLLRVDAKIAQVSQFHRKPGYRRAAAQCNIRLFPFIERIDAIAFGRECCGLRKQAGAYPQGDLSDNLDGVRRIEARLPEPVEVRNRDVSLRID